MTEPRYDPACNLELRQVLQATQGLATNGGEVARERLKATRPVYRFTFEDGAPAVVGKFFVRFPNLTPPDRGLVKEYHAYLQAPALGLTGPLSCVPRLLGCHPQVHLGLLLEAIPGPDLDNFLMGAGSPEGQEDLRDKLKNLAELLAFFHSRPLPPEPLSPRPALTYLDKLKGQLLANGILTHAEGQCLKEERMHWERLLTRFPDHKVLVHGDATPTNFLFPDGRAVAVDLERLRAADRLFDLSWIAGELKHAWGWRFHNFAAGEPAIGHFFGSYLQAVGADAALEDRVYRLNPFYMALAELRIARNDYLSWEYRRALVNEAMCCLTFGRRMA
jgi:aminoglycoside phosphotransferase